MFFQPWMRNILLEDRMVQQTFPYAGPSHEKTYLFIDGGYIRKRYIDAVRVWFGDDADIDFTALIQRFVSAGRSFYYDCLDEEKREVESEADHQARIAEQKAQLNKVRESYGCHIRLGVLKGKERRQKKVDILLAVDMLTHAANKNMSKALLLAGDLDFQPAIESLVQLGIFVELIADDRHTAPELTWAASSYKKLTFADYYYWSPQALQRSYPLPSSGDYLPSIKGATELKTGSLDGYAFTLSQNDDGFYLCLPNFEGNKSHHFVHADLKRLTLYLEKIQGSKITWD
jgi:uncharacterized LabA/DUF88 family protein